MDWKILAGTFGLVFLAELGDKTRLTALAEEERGHETALAKLLETI